VISVGGAEWLARVREVGAANVRHAARGGFLRAYVERFDRPVVARMEAMLAA
jgi:hypothetical protein